MAGGFDGTTRHTSVECYDPTIDRWTLVGEMQSPREGAGLTNLDGILYCVGGYDGNHILNSIERYDPRTGQWTGLAPMNTRRSGTSHRVSTKLRTLGLWAKKCSAPGHQDGRIVALGLHGSVSPFWLGSKRGRFQAPGFVASILGLQVSEDPIPPHPPPPPPWQWGTCLRIYRLFLTPDATGGNWKSYLFSLCSF